MFFGTQCTAGIHRIAVMHPKSFPFFCYSVFCLFLFVKFQSFLLSDVKWPKQSKPK